MEDTKKLMDLSMTRILLNHGLHEMKFLRFFSKAIQFVNWQNIKAWVKSCHPCQRSEIHWHTKAKIGTFQLPDARFSQIHIDFIAPIPPSNDESYCLTIVDRFLRWMEVIPIADRTTEIICRALLSVWISHFGCPAIITTDQGTDFESNLFGEPMCLSSESQLTC
ncbi:transposon Tf2-6 polyprotein [Nephila pilipes]|uniref:Transposon Tf2-6 polyprotein n=1 Tax=Nephila pilipes TaxID=299642 RepID=A0A8X6U2F8_NEPPI|nr:transposon Tf2-6 polyprotein [Nephila pilipes]